MKRLAVFSLLVALVAAPGFADIRIRSVTTSGGDNANETMNITVEAYIKGLLGNFYFESSSNPFMKEGMYLHTPDAGKTLFMVDPENETFSEWDLEAILQFAGNMLEGIGAMVKFEIIDPEVKLVSQGVGPTTHGLSTQAYEFASRYVMRMRIMGMKREEIVEEKARIVTADLPATARVWNRTEPPKTGTEFDKIIEASAWSQIDGVAVAYRTDTVTTSGKKNEQQRSWSETNMEDLDQNSGGPPGGYGYPDHYQRTEMMPTSDQLATGEAPNEESGEKKKKKRFSRFLKKDGGS